MKFGTSAFILGLATLALSSAPTSAAPAKGVLGLPNGVYTKLDLVNQVVGSLEGRWNCPSVALRANGSVGLDTFDGITGELIASKHMNFDQRVYAWSISQDKEHGAMFTRRSTKFAVSERETVFTEVREFRQIVGNHSLGSLSIKEIAALAETAPTLGTLTERERFARISNYLIRVTIDQEDTLNQAKLSVLCDYRISLDI